MNNFIYLNIKSKITFLAKAIYELTVCKIQIDDKYQLNKVVVNYFTVNLSSIIYGSMDSDNYHLLS
jgi:hypothetical protein